MQVDIEDIMIYSFVISIREERQKRFFSSFDQMDFLNKPKVYDGYRIRNIRKCGKDIGFTKRNNVLNITASHLSIVKMAKVLGWPFVCVFEDDCVFTKDFKKGVQRCLNDLPTYAHGLWFGWLKKKKGFKYYNDKLCYNGWATGATGYIIFKEGYTTFINDCYNKIVIDCGVLNGNPKMFKTRYRYCVQIYDKTDNVNSRGCRKQDYYSTRIRNNLFLPQV